jgi:DNA-binding XRE family transcriptional regulator
MAIDLRRSYMEYWHFSPEEKDALIKKLTDALPALRGVMKATQDEVACAVGVSRQTYNAIEMHKRKMSWNTYMSLILLFDYHPISHQTIRQLDAFPYRLDECWLSGKIDQIGGDQ